MGCDIHMFAEVKNKGKWQKVGAVFEHKDFQGAVYINDEPFEGRNYSLFTVLAGVRNYSDQESLDEPRGFPEDVSAEIKKIGYEWGWDGHSHSYFTLKELLEAEWDKRTIEEEGLLSVEDYINLRDNKVLPESWSGGRYGEGWVNLQEDEFDRLEANNELQQGVDYNVWTKWRIRWSDCCEDFISDTIPQLQKLGKPEDVRIVFFFDN